MSIQTDSLTDVLTDVQAATKAMHQTRRALKLVEVLMRHGATPQQAEDLGQDARDVVADLAGITSPSAVTWSIACTLLDHRLHEPVAAPQEPAIVRGAPVDFDEAISA